ncbi:ParA family protein [Leptolyngbya sp. CCY15150]|uniref:ParA family protein n=1 Tax=Leptolyngbya sp. CCY15150 TaxID=2767772 RepID=UPI00194F4308|nr:ParA family protein [Leptolyngbya sp. CCY15150]
MSITLALFNQSGGVGKSTLTMNLGYQLAERQRRVLLVDMDPQASLTTFMGLDPDSLDLTLYNALVDDETTQTVMDLPIQPDIYGMDLCPANINLSAAELVLVSADMRDVRLKDALEPISDRYDVILIDCPPSLGLLSYISLVAATHVLVPIQTQFKAFAGTNLLLNTLARVKRRANRKLAVAGFAPTLFDARRSQDERTLKAIQDRFTTVAPVYDPIPWSTGFADAAEARLPLALYDKRHKAIASLSSIVDHLEKLL